MDFDLDDPLADLLSDDSNGSFFGSATSKKTVPTAKDKVTVNPKAKVANLFGIESENLKEKFTSPSKDAATKIGNSSSATTILPIEQSKKSNQSITPIAQSTQSKKSSKKEKNYDDGSDDILQELSFDSKHTRTPTGSTRKTNIIDELLDFSKSSRDTFKLETSKDGQTPANLQTERPANSDTTTLANRHSPSSGRPRTATRMISEQSVNDPLGFFSSVSKKAPVAKNEEPATVRQKSNKPAAVDWLGISLDKEIAVDSLVTAVNVQPKNIKTTAVTAEQPKFDSSTNLAQSFHQLDITTVHNEGALQTLKQQENQLRIANQMKQQESVLVEMNIKQKALLEQQERQFNELLRRQIQRQAALEESIQRQQEQIGSYLNVLLAQPAIALANISRNSNEYVTDTADEDECTEKRMQTKPDYIELKAEVKRLELEKLRLDDILHSIRTNHEQELDFIETSHKKQIQLLESNAESLEQRLRGENKSIEEHYTKKLVALETANADIARKCEGQLTELITNHEKQLAKLRAAHETEIDQMKTDQRTVIENIRQSKLLEFAVMQENGSYLSTLRSASSYLETASENLQTLRNNIDTNIERINVERELQLEAREKRLEDQQRHMNKMIENAEAERTRLIELIKSLEMKLNSTEQRSIEEQWMLQQRQATLDAERVAFEREKNFMRKKMEDEEKKIQELKEVQFAEHKRLMDIIDAERQVIQNERLKVETMARLKPVLRQTQLQGDQTEIDAAVKIAQDVARQTGVEREKLIGLQRQCESDRHELGHMKDMIRNKENDLERSIKDATEQIREAEQASRSCKSIEKKLMEKLQDLQHNYAELTEREVKLSQAKMELSRERMRLQQMTKQFYEQRCSLCKLSDRRMEDFDNVTKNNDMHTLAAQPESRMPTVDELLNSDAHSIIDKLLLKLDQLPNQNKRSTVENILDPDLLMVNLHLSNSNNN